MVKKLRSRRQKIRARRVKRLIRQWQEEDRLSNSAALTESAKDKHKMKRERISHVIDKVNSAELFRAIKV